MINFMDLESQNIKMEIDMKGNLDMAIEMKKEQFTTKTEIYLLEVQKLITKKVILYIKEKGF